MFIDTHCHIQSVDAHSGERSTRALWERAGDRTLEQVLTDARDAAVSEMICVGCDVADSVLAVQVASLHKGLHASIGIHPHEASRFVNDDHALAQFTALATSDSVVAVGECGLDYFYEHSPKEAQIALLEFQLELAVRHDLPVIFHVREAFDDFWPIFEKYSQIKGVLHSFTDDQQQLERALSHGLYVGVNGIATFAKEETSRAMYRAIPLDRLLLETDAPFLTPVPHRGKVCEPKHVVHTAAYLSTLRGETVDTIAEHSSRNARSLFSL